MLFMKKLSVGKKDKPLADEFINMMLPYKNCVKTIICDNGTEFSDFKRVQKKLDLQFSQSTLFMVLVSIPMFL